MSLLPEDVWCQTTTRTPGVPFYHESDINYRTNLRFEHWNPSNILKTPRVKGVVMFTDERDPWNAIKLYYLIITLIYTYWIFPSLRLTSYKAFETNTVIGWVFGRHRGVTGDLYQFKGELISQSTSHHFSLSLNLNQNVCIRPGRWTLSKGGKRFPDSQWVGNRHILELLLNRIDSEPCEWIFTPFMFRSYSPRTPSTLSGWVHLTGPGVAQELPSNDLHCFQCDV